MAPKEGASQNAPARKKLPWMPYEQATPSGGWGQVLARQLAGEMMGKQRQAMMPVEEIATPVALAATPASVVAANPRPTDVVVAPQSIMAPEGMPTIPLDDTLRRRIYGQKASDSGIGSLLRRA